MFKSKTKIHINIKLKTSQFRVTAYEIFRPYLYFRLSLKLRNKFGDFTWNVNKMDPRTIFPRIYEKKMKYWSKKMHFFIFGIK